MLKLLTDIAYGIPQLYILYNIIKFPTNLSLSVDILKH